jgi:thiosulfate reductase cytochrome b subunit
MQSSSTITMPPWPGLSIVRRILSVLGWVLVTTLLYVHAFDFVATHYRTFLPPPDSLLSQMFFVALEASVLSPFWVFATIVFALLAAGCEQRPSVSDIAVFLLVLGLIGLFLILGFLD